MKNLSILDKLIRVALAIFLIYLAHISSFEMGALVWVAVAAYIYLLMTSLFSFCYAYYILGLRTYRTEPRID